MLYVDDCFIEKFNETLLPRKEHFSSHLNMEDITDLNFTHAKRICQNFNIKNVGEYHDFYVQSVILLLADVFGNFRNMCLEICELESARFFTVRGLP